MVRVHACRAGRPRSHCRLHFHRSWSYADEVVHRHGRGCAIRLLRAMVHRPLRPPTLLCGVVIEDVAFRRGSPACRLGLSFTAKSLNTSSSATDRRLTTRRCPSPTGKSSSSMDAPAGVVTAAVVHTTWPNPRTRNSLLLRHCDA